MGDGKWEMEVGAGGGEIEGGGREGPGVLEPGFHFCSQFLVHNCFPIRL